MAEGIWGEEENYCCKVEGGGQLSMPVVV